MKFDFREMRDRNITFCRKCGLLWLDGEENDKCYYCNKRKRGKYSKEEWEEYMQEFIKVHKLGKRVKGIKTRSSTSFAHAEETGVITSYRNDHFFPISITWTTKDNREVTDYVTIFDFKLLDENEKWMQA